MRNCWGQVRIVEDDVRKPAPHPTPYFVIKNGLLYCSAQRRGEEKLLLVVPKYKTATILERAHTHPMAGHMGVANTAHNNNDNWKLNEVCSFDGYPMPRVDELLDRLGRACFISTLDLTKGYWQVPPRSSKRKRPLALHRAIGIPGCYHSGYTGCMPLIKG